MAAKYTDAAIVAGVKDILNDYHQALNERQHGDVAANHLIIRLEALLDTPRKPSKQDLAPAGIG